MPWYRPCNPSFGSALLLAVALFAVQTASAGGKNAFSYPPEEAAAHNPDQATHTVEIKDFKYRPALLTVKIGDTVEWKNEDIFPHTVTAVNKSFDSGSISPGGSWKFVARKTGSFDYFCTFHPNMKGKLVVQ
ncbi:MAG TPA: cupredoxin family copper-binding protein [Bryobacteraceae bacterium]|nr:cupredoxin family copper-binding protein [Bryobacteraceae bacterium]